MPLVEFNESVFQALYLREALRAITSPWEINIPTLYDEKRLGYDAHIFSLSGHDVFYQFKRPTARKRRSRDDVINKIVPPYFEFRLHTAKQHNRLHTIASKTRNAFYVAPAFSARKELMTRAYACTLLDNCVAIDPAVLGGRVKNNRHRYVYESASSPVRFFSHAGDSAELPPAREIMKKVLASAPRPFEQLLRDAYFGTLNSRHGERVERKEVPADLTLLRLTIKRLTRLNIHWCLILTATTTWRDA